MKPFFMTVTFGILDGWVTDINLPILASGMIDEIMLLPP